MKQMKISTKINRNTYGAHMQVTYQNKQHSLTYGLVAVSFIIEHGGSFGSIAAGLHGPQPHLVLWKTL